MSGSPPSPERGTPGARNRGVTPPGCLTWLTLLLLLSLAGYKAGEALWVYYQVREQVRDALIWTVAGGPKNEVAIAQRVISQVASAEVRLSPRNIRITQTHDSLTISVFWTHDLDFYFYTHPLRLEVSLTEIKRWERGGLVIR